MTRILPQVALLALAAFAIAAAPPQPSGAPAAPIAADDLIWLQKPTGDDVARTFPDKAVRIGRPGAVLLECQIDGKGLLTACQVQAETPSGFGFGDAGLDIAQRFRAAPLSRSGRPTAGAIVRIPFPYQLPHDAASPYPPKPPFTNRAGSPAYVLSFGRNGDTACPTVTEPKRTCTRHDLAWADSPEAAAVRAAERTTPVSTPPTILACVIGAAGALSACAAPADAPPAAKAAMLALAPTYRAPPETKDKEPTAGKTVVMLFDWPAIRHDLETTRTLPPSPAAR